MMQTVKQQIFDPIKRKFLDIMTLISVLENQENDTKTDINLLIEVLDTVKKQIDVYLNYELFKKEN